MNVTNWLQIYYIWVLTNWADLLSVLFVEDLRSYLHPPSPQIPLNDFSDMCCLLILKSSSVKMYEIVRNEIIYQDPFQST